MDLKLKRPHGESQARAPPSARIQVKPKVKQDLDSSSSGPRPSAPRVYQRYPRRTGDLPKRMAPSSLPPQQPPQAAKPRTKKNQPTERPKRVEITIPPEHSIYTRLGAKPESIVRTKASLPRARDPHTNTFMELHRGYYYQPKRTAPKVVKPAELLVDPRSRYLQALSDLLNEIESARVREEEAENSDLKDSERGNKNEGNDEEMQQFVKDLVLDIDALNSGKSVELEPQFEDTSPDFFISIDHMHKNVGHAALPVFFSEVLGEAKARHEYLVERHQDNIFWNESTLPAVAAPGFELGSTIPAPKKPTRPKDLMDTKKACSMDGASQEIRALRDLLNAGFVTPEEFEERLANLRASIQLRETLAKRREAELDKLRREEKREWELRKQKLRQEVYLERREESTRAVIRAFLDGKVNAKELAMHVRNGTVTVEELLSLWENDLRPIQLTDYYDGCTLQADACRHSKVLADVMYLLEITNPNKQHGKTLDPTALPQTREVLHTVEKIARRNPEIVREFAHYIRVERQARTEWQRSIQENVVEAFPKKVWPN